MRVLLLLSLVLSIPLLAQAQEGSDFERGSFKLNTTTETYSGLLRPDVKNLVVKQYANEPTVKYPWQEVTSYRLGLRNYVKASGFLAKSSSGWSQQPAQEEFVELLDSGTVSLMRYRRSFAGGPDEVLYLLKRATEPTATTIPFSALDGAGKNFREFLLPYLADRPDLVALVSAKKVTIYNLQTLIKAYNTQTPFLTYPMQKPLSERQ